MVKVTKTKNEKTSYKPYCKIVDTSLCNELRLLSKTLHPYRIVHINSTPRGGGVAEILHSLIPLTEAFGIRSDWYTFTAPSAFFEVTRKMHDLLQGKRGMLTNTEKKIYLSTNKKLANEIEKIPGDIFFIHDPQPLALASFLSKTKRMRELISIFHIDLTAPNIRTQNFILPFFTPYKKIFVSLPEYFRIKDIIDKRIVAPVAIDPVTLKNKEMPKVKAEKIVHDLGINPKMPILLRVLRYDPWKDPLSTVALHQMLKKDFPKLQTVILGFQLAQDDTTARKVYTEVAKHAQDVKDLKLFFHLAEAKKYSVDEVVGAFLQTATVFEHKSIKEGFGMVVTEAMWKGLPVIGGNVGGIKLQIEDGVNGYLVNTVLEAKKVAKKLLNNSTLRKKIGVAARERVRQHFLNPRLLRDYLREASRLT